MTKTPIVSIVIPCFNMGRYIRDAVDSVYAQNYKDYEIIVVDDGSTDHSTRELLKSMEVIHPDLRVFYKENSGLAGARNYGVTQARGKYISCLDADDMLAPAYLEKTVPILEKDTSEELGFVTTWVREFGVRDNIWQTSDFDIVKLLISNVAHAGSLFRRSAWSAIGGYKAVMTEGYEDWEFWINMAEEGFKWALVPESLFRYRIRENSMLKKVSEKIHIKLYSTIYGLHEDLFKKHTKELTFRYAKELKKLRQAVAEKDDAMEEYKQAVDYHKSQTSGAIERLESLQRSRFTQLAMKLIAWSIFVRTKGPALKPKLSRGIKRLMPKFMAKMLMRIYRVLYPIRKEITENQKWPGAKPLVSIVTPFYNHGASIAETVESVLSQTFQNFEYFIINDGSRKEEAQVLNTIKDKRLQIINYDVNLGEGSPATPRNDGISRASGKYIICLDADDALDPTFIEKCLVIMETNPAINLVTTDTQTFGATDEVMHYIDYDPRQLIENNMIISGAMFKREAWELTGGYKAGIGYEDWEYWINMAEHGCFGAHLPETIFRYRTAVESRFIEDRKKHRDNIQTIRTLHSNYTKTVKKIVKSKRRKRKLVKTETAFVNLSNNKDYLTASTNKNVLIAIPWMTFGGAETLIINFCEEIKHAFNLSFVTGLMSEHEWEYKFKGITPNVFHLANLFDDKKLYLEFISNYIATRQIDMLHIIHTDYVFNMLPELKRRHPKLKVLVTMFNDRVEHFPISVQYKQYIDSYASDNKTVGEHYKQLLGDGKKVTVIPNGINCYDIYNPELHDRFKERTALGVRENELAVFFIGRLSPEKNPDVFLRVAARVINDKNTDKVKFFIIGDGVSRNQVESMVSNIGHGSVQYLGYQSEIARFLSAADIFVLPSSIEGFPLSILEAMAMRVAVIASDVGAVSEVIKSGQDGFVVTPESEEEILDHILIMDKDRAILEKVKIRAREKLEKTYSNIALGKNYTKLYKDLMK